MFKHLVFALFCSLIQGPAAAGSLHDAVEAGDQDALEAALSGGADPNEPDSEGRPAILIAAGNGNAAAIRLLASHGADPNRSRDNPRGYVDAPIHAAVKNGQLEAIRALADVGADLWMQHYELGAPIHIAVTESQPEVVALLRSLGADELQIDPITHLISGADIEFGRRVAAICSKCHEIEKGIMPEGAGYGRLGPSLINIVGRKKGADASYAYSEAMRAAGGEWGYEELNHFVVNPTVFIPGTDMWIGGLPVERPRVALIAYLRSITENPPTLPN